MPRSQAYAHRSTCMLYTSDGTRWPVGILTTALTGQQCRQRVLTREAGARCTPQELRGRAISDSTAASNDGGFLLPAGAQHGEPRDRRATVLIKTHPLILRIPTTNMSVSDPPGRDQGSLLTVSRLYRCRTEIILSNTVRLSAGEHAWPGRRTISCGPSAACSCW